MDSDVKAIRVTATGDVGVGPARIRQVHVLNAAGAGRLTITNGNGGDTLLDIDFVASDSQSVNIPDNGIRAEAGLWVSVLTTITAATIFYS